MIQLCLMFPQMMFDRKGRLISLKHVRSVPLSSSFSSRRSPAHWGCEEADESEGNAIKWSIQGSYLCCLGAMDCYKRGWRRTLFLQTLLKVIQGVVTEAVLWKNNKNKIKKRVWQRNSNTGRPPLLPTAGQSLHEVEKEAEQTHVYWFYGFIDHGHAAETQFIHPERAKFYELSIETVQDNPRAILRAAFIPLKL